MTEEAKVQLAKDVLYGASTAAKEYGAVKVKLGMIGERLERLGHALQHQPEIVRPLPEVGSEYDYRDCLNELGSARQQVVDLCEELRTLAHRRNKAEERKITLNL